MAITTRQQILAAKDWETKDVDVDAWGTVRLRALSARERLNLVEVFGGGQITNEQAFDFFTQLIVWSLVDENGERLFTDDDKEALQGKSWTKLQAVADEIMKFNGMSEGVEGN